MVGVEKEDISELLFMVQLHKGLLCYLHQMSSNVFVIMMEILTIRILQKHFSPGLSIRLFDE